MSGSKVFKIDCKKTYCVWMTPMRPILSVEKKMPEPISIQILFKIQPSYK